MVRRGGLEETMSSYLIERIAAAPNIQLHTRLDLAALEGDENGLSKVHCRGIKDGKPLAFDTRHMFLFVGADPNSDWLRECGVGLDDKGFVLSGPDAGREQHGRGLETSVDGVFVVGDLRSGSTKRVAAAAGEGAAVVSQIHGYLAAREPA
jgi:thioredoxin reductase (NADPH)